jgi:hypothetical protein
LVLATGVLNENGDGTSNASAMLGTSTSSSSAQWSRRRITLRPTPYRSQGALPGRRSLVSLSTPSGSPPTP